MAIGHSSCITHFLTEHFSLWSCVGTGGVHWSTYRSRVGLSQPLPGSVCWGPVGLGKKDPAFGEQPLCCLASQSNGCVYIDVYIVFVYILVFTYMKGCSRNTVIHTIVGCAGNVQTHVAVHVQVWDLWCIACTGLRPVAHCMYSCVSMHIQVWDLCCSACTGLRLVFQCMYRSETCVAVHVQVWD